MPNNDVILFLLEEQKEQKKKIKAERNMADILVSFFININAIKKQISNTCKKMTKHTILLFNCFY